ncbi:MAG: hypothetical protein ACLQDM_31255 [Bradyrhizobium sp.]
MRWKFRVKGHDPRQIDLLAAVAIVIAIVVIGRYFSHRPEPPVAGAFIEPSQTVRW